MSATCTDCDEWIDGRGRCGCAGPFRPRPDLLPQRTGGVMEKSNKTPCPNCGKKLRHGWIELNGRILHDIEKWSYEECKKPTRPRRQKAPKRSRFQTHRRKENETET